MIKLYISPSCASCRKVRDWFKEQKIPFEEKNIFSGELTDDDIREILTKSLDGTDDIISKRSDIIRNGHIDVGAMTLNELIDFVKKNPSCLKRPIIVDTNKIQVGYNAEEIRAFIPAYKRVFFDNCTHNCPKYQTCTNRAEHPETKCASNTQL